MPQNNADYPGCREYQCVPSDVFESEECPSGQVKRCADFGSAGSGL